MTPPAHARAQDAASPEPHAAGTTAHRLWLALEFVALFLVVPLLFAMWRADPDAVTEWITGRGAPDWLIRAARPGNVMMPTLALFALGCLLALVFDRSFDKRSLWRPRAIFREFVRVMLLWVPAAAGIWALTTWLHPDWLFRLPLEIPLLWLAIMALYPIFSVYPQGLIYRPFFFHRYQRLFPKPAVMIAASAIAFGWMHIVFLNWIAPALCLAGGVLFAWTYHRSKSALAATFEHALYGCWIFTIGLGLYFFGGAQRDEDGNFVPPERSTRQVDPAIPDATP